MKIMGLCLEGILQFLAMESEIRFETFEKNMPNARWLLVEEVEGEDDYNRLAQYLENPLQDEKGRYNYKISDKGVITLRTEKEKGSDIVEANRYTQNIPLAERLGALEDAVLSILAEG